MNSLEFIEKEIANIREFLGLDDVLCLQTEEDYKFWYDRLKTLQQIKAELEAWEICKNDPVILSTIKTLTEGKSINWHRLSEKQRESIKKVLEVEDE